MKIEKIYAAVTKEEDGILNERLTCPGCGETISIPRPKYRLAVEISALGQWLREHEVCLLPKHKAPDEEVEGERHKPPSIEDEPEGSDD